jgi:hypothetical protein
MEREMRKILAFVSLVLFGTLISSVAARAAESNPVHAGGSQAVTEQTGREKERDRGQTQTQDQTPDGSEDATSDAKQRVPRHDISVLDEVPEACWQAVRSQRVYFAHGPVGKDLLIGLHAILDERPLIGWKIIAYGEAPTSTQAGASAAPPPFGTPAIVEGPTGADGDPISKIDRFVAKLRSKEGQEINTAILLLSAEDFTRETNVESLHAHYVQAIRSLKSERNGLRIVHSTIPLAVPDHGVAGRMKKMVGRGADHVNAQRGRFNDLLRAEFGREAIFDIAHAESERSDGKACSVHVGSVRWPALAPEHANDRGQLNDEGRFAVAREFAIALVRPCLEARMPREAEVTVVPSTGSSD